MMFAATALKKKGDCFHITQKCIAKINIEFHNIWLFI